MKRRIYIHDSTLREGNQSRQGNFTTDEKIFIAKLLKNLGVDSMEIGFGGASKKEDFEMIKIIEEIGIFEDSPIIASLTGLNQKFVEQTMTSLQKAKYKRICLLTSGSDEHLSVKFSSKGENNYEIKKTILNLIKENTLLAVKEGFQVQLTTEDSISADKKYLLDSIIVAIESGATVINLPDTLGKGLFYEIEDLFLYLTNEIKFLKDKGYNFIFTTHHHNDMGLAIANNIGAIRGGAQGIEATLLGLGDRNGISSLEETVLNIYERSDKIILGQELILPRFKKELLGPTVRAMTKLVGFQIDPNKPLIGQNNNSHGAGIHNSANNKGKKLGKQGNIYETLFLPDYGLSKPSKILSSTGGRGEVLAVLEDYGIILDKYDEVVQKITDSYKEEAVLTKGVYPSKIYFYYLKYNGLLNLKDKNIIISGNKVKISLTLCGKDLVIEGEAGLGNGVVDATVNGLKSYFQDLGNEKDISVGGFYEKVNFPISEIIDNFNQNVGLRNKIDSGFIENKDIDTGSKKQIVVGLTLKIDGDKVSIKQLGHNAELSSVKAVLKCALYYLFKSLN